MDYSTQIKNYQRELGINRGIIDQEYWHIGTSLADTPPQAEPLTGQGKERFENLLQDVEREKASKERLEGEIEEIRTQLIHIEELEQGKAQRLEESARLKEGFTGELRDFAQKAFEIYTGSPSSYLPLAESFSGLEKLHRDKYTFEAKLEALRKKNESDPLLKRMVNQTKIQLQLNQQKGLGKKIDEQFAVTARNILGNSEITSDDYPTLAPLLDPVRTTRTKIEELERIIDKHSKDLESDKSQLREMSGNKKPEEHIKRAEVAISECDEALRKLYTEIGQLAFENLGKKIPPGLEEYWKNLKQLKKENQERIKMIAKLEAAQKIEALDAEKARFALKAQKLQVQLENTQSQIERIKQTITELDQRIEEQSEIRGDLDQ